MGPFGQQGGFTAWLLWLGIHIAYLIGFTNRLVVLTRWAWSFVTHGRGSRLITEGELLPPIAEPEPPALPPPDENALPPATSTPSEANEPSTTPEPTTPAEPTTSAEPSRTR
jgi:hypothetical protein